MLAIDMHLCVLICAMIDALSHTWTPIQTSNHTHSSTVGYCAVTLMTGFLGRIQTAYANAIRWHSAFLNISLIVSEAGKTSQILVRHAIVLRSSQVVQRVQVVDSSSNVGLPMMSMLLSCRSWLFSKSSSPIADKCKVLPLSSQLDRLRGERNYQFFAVPHHRYYCYCI